MVKTAPRYRNGAAPHWLPLPSLTEPMRLLVQGETTQAGPIVDSPYTEFQSASANQDRRESLRGWSSEGVHVMRGDSAGRGDGCRHRRAADYLSAESLANRATRFVRSAWLSSGG